LHYQTNNIMNREEKINLAKEKISDACAIINEVLGEDDYELTDYILELIDNKLEKQ